MDPAVSAAVTSRSCAQCGEAAAADARYCEACGADLPVAAAPADPGAAVLAPAGPGAAARPPAAPASAAPGAAEAPAIAAAAAAQAAAPTPSPVASPPACRECGGEVDPDGYCTVCGAKAPRARDHVVERPQSWVAGVSDRGIRHHRNEDAMALAADAEPGSRAVLVVCDGVSSAPDSDVASLAAARAAVKVLEGPGARGAGTAQARAGVVAARVVASGEAANAAVVAATSTGHRDSPPSCTFAVAVLEDGTVTAGVVGDSRVYWVPDDGDALLLTEDDSWAAQEIAAGASRQVVESLPQAHAITRWLGADSHDHTPRVTSEPVGSAGWVLVCSDGLWNYASEPRSLAEVVRAVAGTSGADPLATASALVDWANEQGGRDNITVALARLGDVRPTGAPR